ncbi:MAG: phosphate ABC transporter substrate-binding protein PstS [Akkermansiaceae bacterium]|nr:phosphate ABC transporter substrate-binding protein PstS [Akkermansiaceae bacterium]
MLKKLFILMSGLASMSQAGDVAITGAGASFPAPVYRQWTYSYSEQNPGIQITYQSVGSGAGLNQIKSGTVDFAGTDSPLTLQQQEESGLVQFPMLTGGVVVIVNVPGVKDSQLLLSKEVLADIYLGKIRFWNDPAIKALNPGLRLPKLKITVVHRSDSSGTSFIFTNYLSKVSPAWKSQVGQGASVKWPVGIGGQKNPGVCNTVSKVRGSIGYTEYTYAVEAKLACACLENAAGNYVAPSQDSFSAAAACADWKNAPGFYMELTNVPGAKSWPITGVTYILLRKDTPDNVKKTLRDYFMWCYTDGAATAKKLNYVALPPDVVKLVEPTL